MKTTLVRATVIIHYRTYINCSYHLWRLYSVWYRSTVSLVHFLNPYALILLKTWKEANKEHTLWHVSDRKNTQNLGALQNFWLCFILLTIYPSWNKPFKIKPQILEFQVVAFKLSQVQYCIRKQLPLNDVTKRQWTSSTCIFGFLSLDLMYKNKAFGFLLIPLSFSKLSTCYQLSHILYTGSFLIVS